MPVFSLLTAAACLIQPQAQPQPRIAFDALHHDFGKITGETKVTHRFKVTNQGKAYLNITRLNPSCGCTSTVLGKWSLAPGESTEIEATFNPVGFRGLSRKSIQVVSDDPINPTQTLTFEADVVREIMPSTESVFFQDVVRSTPRKASVKLESGSGSPVRVTEARAGDAPWLTATSRADGKDAWVDFTLDGRKLPAGKRIGADTIVVRTANPRVPTVNITVQWELRPTVTVDPPRAAWVEPAGQERTMTLKLKHVDNKPFRITSAKTTNPILRVDLDGKGASATHVIKVVLSAKAKAGTYMEKVLLTLDDPDQPELEIRASAALR
jgi:hypothetical protein